jgi:NADH:ubiquinone reductase (non-electrogenic)
MATVPSLSSSTLTLLISIIYCVLTADAFVTPSPYIREALAPRTNSLLQQHSSNDESSNPKQPHIVILGGGFGGINTALTLPTLPWSDKCMQPKITLIDKSERFVFLPLLYELCVEDASIDEVAPTFKSLLKDGRLPSLPGLSNLSGMIGASATGKGTDDISFVQAKVEGIDVNNQQVVVSTSSDGKIETIDYDALVIATGAEISLDGIPGASECALPFYTVEQCLELKRRLVLLDSYLDEKAKNGDDAAVNLVVVGGGYSGVELALNLVDRLDNNECNVQVTLVHRGEQVLQYATEYNRNTGIDRLKSAGVNVMTSTSIVEVVASDGAYPDSNRCVVKLQSSSSNDDESTTSLDTSLLLWTAGATPTSSQNEGIRNSILSRDVMGRILTSLTLNVPEYPNVFAIGDCSRPKKEPYPGTAQVAIQMATVASWNIYATLANDTTKNKESLKLLPFTYLSLGEMMTLGRNDATISTLGGIELSGAGASWLRRLIYAVRMPTDRQRVAAAVDGTARKLARGALEASKRKSKPVDWK